MKITIAVALVIALFSIQSKSQPGPIDNLRRKIAQDQELVKEMEKAPQKRIVESEVGADQIEYDENGRSYIAHGEAKSATLSIKDVKIRLEKERAELRRLTSRQKHPTGLQTKA